MTYEKLSELPGGTLLQDGERQYWFKPADNEMLHLDGWTVFHLGSGAAEHIANLPGLHPVLPEAVAW